MPIVPEKPYLFKNKQGAYIVHFAKPNAKGRLQLTSDPLRDDNGWTIRDETEAEDMFQHWIKNHPEECKNGTGEMVVGGASLGLRGGNPQKNKQNGNGKPKIGRPKGRRNNPKPTPNLPTLHVGEVEQPRRPYTKRQRNLAQELDNIKSLVSTSLHSLSVAVGMLTRVVDQTHDD